MRYVVGIDLGGTNIVVGTVAEDGSELLGLVSEPTMSQQGADAVLGRIVKLARASMAEARGKEIAGVGIGSPGPLNTKTGIVLLTPNLGWTNFPLRDVIAERTRLPVRIDNDANCATLGEWWLGAARGANNVIGMTIGTGIGGGIILGGRLYHGSSDVAGEIGHATIDITGRRCKCGNYGCLEAYASGPSIADRAREAVGSDDEAFLVLMVGGDANKITAATVYEAAKLGDDVALDVVRETSRFLGAGIANLLNIFNPDVVVIAGGVTQAGETLFGPLRREVRKRAFKPAVEACQIVPGTLVAAGVVGAVAAYKQQD